MEFEIDTIDLTSEESQEIFRFTPVIQKFLENIEASDSSKISIILNYVCELGLSRGNLPDQMREMFAATLELYSHRYLTDI